MSDPMPLAPPEAEAARPARRLAYAVWALVAIVIAAALFAMLRSSPAAAADPAATVHSEGDMTMEWSIRQYPAVVLQNNGFQLKLTSSPNEPVTGATIGVKLEMLDMVCGDYEFELRETSPGIYEGDGVPLMPGLWRATATVEPAKGGSFTVIRTLKAEY